jgi:uncharacterized protein YkwD
MHRRVILVVAISCWTLLLHADEPKKDPAAGSFEMTAHEKELLELTNAEREKEKLPPLKPNATLFKVARAHSANMAKKKEMAHILDGKSPARRVDDAGYDFGLIGENIAWSSMASLKEVVQGWMDSEVHRENLLNKTFVDTGLGIAKDDDGKYYFTQVFTRPRKRR